MTLTVPGLSKRRWNGRKRGRTSARPSVALDEAGVAFEDLQTKQSSLEEIFVTLVHEASPEASS
jgi:hypothetical protein